MLSGDSITFQNYFPKLEGETWKSWRKMEVGLICMMERLIQNTPIHGSELFELFSLAGRAKASLKVKVVGYYHCVTETYT